VKQERGALQRRQPVQRQQEREGKIIREFGRRFRRKAVRIEHRFRQPGADIDLALHFGALQTVEAKPRHDRDEKSLGVPDILGAGEAQIGVLHHVLGVAAAAEHAIGKPKQPPTIGRQWIVVTRPA